jgi:2-methylcitrate dehydratase PrpD
LNGGHPRMAHQIKGFRPTASAGPLGAVAVLARLAGCSSEECAQALGLACSQGGGLRRSPIVATPAIRIQSGEVMRRAVQTVRLSRAGVATHPDILRASGGYFSAYAAGELGQVALPKVGVSGHLASASMKLDCTPHTLATMLDAARAIASREDFAAVGITSVVVSVPAQHHVISGDDKAMPANFAEAASHVPFCVALAVLRNSYLYPYLLRDAIGDPEVISLALRVTFVVDDRLGEIFESDSSSWPARVEVTWASGERTEFELLAPETSHWSADQALHRAAAKVEALVDGRNHSAAAVAELVAQFARVTDWADVWAEIDASSLTLDQEDRPE